MAYVTLHHDHREQWVGRPAAFEQSLKDHARKRLPGFACPEWVEIVEELPVSHLKLLSLPVDLNILTENFDG
jgi:acyl-coenzyme A synthetase/AMP-(fatty) acid ligase